MIKLDNYKYYNTKNWIPFIVSNLHETLKNKGYDIDLHIDLVNVYFYLKSTDISKEGPMGWIGPHTYKEDDDRELTDQKYLKLHMTLKLDGDYNDSDFLEYTKDFKLASNTQNENLNLLDFRKCNKCCEKSYGYYKIDKFDEFYNIFKKIKPNITPEEFAKYGIIECCDYFCKYNKDFVKVEEYDPNKQGLIEQFNKKVKDGITTDIKLSILTIDIEQNIDLLIKLIDTLYKLKV